ncbi:MAG: hypothetical protein JWN06_137 [Propionibacteriaceae bacterium]|jgi:hypothetical protein|nr:hypothetical protein [Propionibacteriaceae bacterium]
MRRLPYVIAYVIATALIITGLIYGLRSRGGDDDKPSAATPSAKATPVKYMSSDGVIENIERRLTEHQGRQMKASCPKRVAMTVGSTFTCDVYFADRKDAIGIAQVKIDGPNGEFSWKSKPIAKSTSTPTS